MEKIRGMRRSRFSILFIGFLTLSFFFFALKTDHKEVSTGLFVVVCLCLAFLWSCLKRQANEIFHLRRDKESLQLILEDQRDETTSLEAISEINESFIEKIEIKPVLERVGNYIDEQLNPDILVTYLLSPELGGEEIKLVKGAEHFELPDILLDHVLEKGRSLLINDLSPYPKYDSLRHRGIDSMAISPFRTRHKTLGLIAAFNKKGKDFTSHEQYILNAFANHISILIDNIQLVGLIRDLTLKGKKGKKVEDLHKFKDLLSVEKYREEAELGLAKEIQNSLLPSQIPKIKNLSLNSFSQPASSVGGDYYDFLKLEDNKWAIALADVSGKGVPAALVMTMLRTVLHLIPTEQKSSPGRCLELLNRFLYRETESTMFVSMIYGIWCPQENNFVFANAGHEPPLLYRKGQKVQTIEDSGVVLGMKNGLGSKIKSRTIHLSASESLFLYTDGATDVFNNKDEKYGIERLSATFQKSVESSHDEVLGEIGRSIEDFSKGEPLEDDITLLLLRGKD